MTLSEVGVEAFTGGGGCPEESNLELKFKLKSTLLGPNDQELTIPIRKELASILDRSEN